MLKSTEEGIVRTGKIIPLSEDDLETILEMFAEYQGFCPLSKEDGVWKGRTHGDFCSD